MSRPADHRWEVLGESGDPVPGDAYDMKALSKRFAKTAKSISDTAAALRRVSDENSWDSDAGRKFAEKAQDTAKTVSKAYERYEEAGKALKTYYTELERIQPAADKLLTQAETKDGELGTAKSAAANPPKDTDKEAQGKLDGKVTELSDALGDLRTALSGLKTAHKKAGDDAARLIHTVTEGDDLNDSWLDDLRDTLSTIANIAGTIAAVCGILSLLVGWIPVIGQALAAVLGTIALIATAISLVCNILLYINGDVGLSKVLMDVVGLATFGIGRVFQAGAKVAATAGRSKVWTAATNYVRAWNPGVNSAGRRRLVQQMVGRRAGATPGAAAPDISFGAAFRGLPSSIAGDLGVIKTNWRGLFKFSDNAAAVRNAWNAGGVRGLGSMYTGPGMVDELGRIKNIDPVDLALIGTPDAFNQALRYNSIGLTGLGTAASMDGYNFAGLFGGPPMDVTGPQPAPAGR